MPDIAPPSVFLKLAESNLAKTIKVCEEQYSAAVRIAEEELQKHLAREILAMAQTLFDEGVRGKDLSEQVHTAIEFAADRHRDAQDQSPAMRLYNTIWLYAGIEKALAHDEADVWRVEKPNATNTRLVHS